MIYSFVQIENQPDSYKRLHTVAKYCTGCRCRTIYSENMINLLHSLLTVYKMRPCVSVYTFHFQIWLTPYEILYWMTEIESSSMNLMLVSVLTPVYWSLNCTTVNFLQISFTADNFAKCFMTRFIQVLKPIKDYRGFCINNYNLMVSFSE